MGKLRKRNKFPRTNPTGLQSVKDCNADKTLEFSCNLQSSNGALLGAIEKLQSAVLSDRECGAEGLALVAKKKESLDELMKKNVVRIAAPLLLDNSPTIRHSIAGSLRNMTAVGGHTVCEDFVEKDVMTPVVHLYKKFYEDWKPAVPKGGKIDSSTEIFIEVTHLLWNLCESSEQAVSIFNQQNLLAILLPCLQVSVYGPRVALVSAQCLQAVTENNVDLLAQYTPDSFRELLCSLLSLDGGEPILCHLRVLAAGIYLNINGGKLIGSPPEGTSVVLHVLSTTLSVSLPDTVQAFKDEEDNLNCADKPEEDLILGVKTEGEEMAKENILNILSAKQVALEVLTNICCNDDGDDEWESLCSSEAGEDDAQVPMEEDTPAEMDSVPQELQAAFAVLNLFPKVECHAFVPEAVVALLACTKKGSETFQKLKIMQCRALLCLHNMVAGGIEVPDTQTHLHELWLRLAQLVLATAANKNQDEVELLEAMTGCLRSVVQKLSEQKILSSVTHLTLDDLNALYRVTQECSDAKSRVNVLRTVATIGMLMQCDQSPKQEPFIASIGQFLLELGLKDEDVWVNAEAADAIMDVFAEDHLDAVAQQIKLVPNCCHIQRNLKSKARSLRKQPGEHLPMVAMAKTNLSRFIKYKSKQTVSES